MTDTAQTHGFARWRPAPWLWLAALGTFAFALSCRLAFARPDEPDPGAVGGDSISGHLFGAARIALGTHFLEMTDIYYHAGGTGRLNDRDWPDTWFRNLERRIVPRQHRHVQGHAVAEMLPMLWFATRADPHNIDNYLVGAYWLSTSHGLDRPDLALELLREGRLRNPRHYRIRIEEALVWLRKGRTDRAAQALDAALALWPGAEDPESVEARTGKIYALTYRALIHESDGMTDEAIARWEQLLALQPDDADTAHRLRQLKSGAPPPVLASEVWQRILRRSDTQRAACDHDHDHDHDHH